MKKSRSLPLAIVLTALLVGAPLGYFLNSLRLEKETLVSQNTELNSEIETLKTAVTTEGEMLFYDLNGLSATASSKAVSFAELFTAEDLNARAIDCAKTTEAGYFEGLTTQLAEVEGVQYSFTANEAESEVYTVTVFPNAAEYRDLAEFQADFEACSVGGTAAARMNEEALMFASACSAAYEETPALTCSDIQEGLVLEFN